MEQSREPISVDLQLIELKEEKVMDEDLERIIEEPLVVLPCEGQEGALDQA